MTDGPTNKQLGAYQAALLDTLYAAGESGSDMAADINAAADAANLNVGRLDPTLLEVAADLTRTWGRLDG